MAVSRHLAVDRAAQVQVADDRAWAQVEVLADQRGRYLPSGMCPVPKVSTLTLSGRATPMA